MAQTGPWNVRGIDPDLREAAALAARKSGMSLGQWLNAVIADSAADQGLHPAAATAAPEEDLLATVIERIEDLRARRSNAPRSGGAQDGDTARVAAIVERAIDTFERTARRNEEKTAAALQAITSLVEQSARAGAAPPDRNWGNPGQDPYAFSMEANPVRHLIERIEGRLDALAPALPVASGVEQHLRDLDRRLEDIARKLDQPDTTFARKAEAAPGRPIVSESRETILERQRYLESGDGMRYLPPQRVRPPVAPKATGNEQQLKAVLRADIEQLSRAIEELAPRERLAGIETAIRDLSERTERLKEVGQRPPQMPALDAVLYDLRQAVQALRDPGPVAVLRRDLKDLSDRLLRPNQRNEETLAALQSQMNDMHHLVARASMPVALDGLEQRLDRLASMLERVTARPQDIGASIGLTGAISDMRSTLDHLQPTEVLAKLEERIGALSALESRLSTLAARLEQAPGGENLRVVEATLQALAAKLDATHSAIDDSAFLTLKGDLSRIAARLDQGGGAENAGLDRSLGDLFAQLESLRSLTVEAAENAARNVVPAAGSEASVTALSRELTDIRRAQSESDRATQAMLNSVNGALGRIIDRLDQMESEPAVAARPSARVPAKKAAASADAGVPSSGKIASPPAAGDMLIEPGAGHPLRREPVMAADAAPAVDPRASFIAAARRAAHAAAQQSGEALRAHQDSAAAPVASASGGNRLAAIKDFVTTRRRPIMIGIIAALIGVIALQAVSVMRRPPAELSAPEITNSAPRLPAKILNETPSQPLPAPAQNSEPQRANELPPVAATPEAKPAAPEAPAIGALAALNPQIAAVSSERLRNAALAGDAAALYEIGLRYAEARGMPRDPATGLKLLEASAELGLAPAQYRVGTLYREGRGVPVNKPAALSWFKRAAEAGNARAMHNAGVLLAEGVSGTPDYAAAVEWFTRAADLNIRDSQYNLAILYARGLGVTQDLAASYKWFNAAAAQGDEDARKKRDEVASRLPPEKQVEVKAMSEQWKPLQLDAKANEVPVPQGGWDAPVKALPKPKSKGLT